VAGGAGDGEDERRPARSCGRLPSFSLLFLLLPFFPSPASREIQRAAMRPERGWWPAPPLAPSPVRAFTRG
jgi:hypothetical protein